MATEAERAAARALLGERGRRRDGLLELARDLDRNLDETLGVRAVVVVGSVARGDFNRWSDVDVLVIADDLPPKPLDRLDILFTQAPPGVQPIAWTPEEFVRERDRHNPIATEALEIGVAIRGREALEALAG